MSEANSEPTILSEVVVTLPEDLDPTVGYMCKTDYDDEMGYASDGVRVFPSLRALKEARKCLDQCGIVKVRIQLLEVIQESDFSVDTKNIQ